MRAGRPAAGVGVAGAVGVAWALLGHLAAPWLDPQALPLRDPVAWGLLAACGLAMGVTAVFGGSRALAVGGAAFWIAHGLALLAVLGGWLGRWLLVGAVLLGVGGSLLLLAWRVGEASFERRRPRWPRLWALLGAALATPGVAMGPSMFAWAWLGQHRGFPRALESFPSDGRLYVLSLVLILPTLWSGLALGTACWGRACGRTPAISAPDPG